MAPPRKSIGSVVVAREAIVITVGARPIQYGTITIADRKTGDLKTIPNHNNIIDPGDEGMPYAFKALQKVSRDHPAVEANPDAFAALEELDDSAVVPAPA